MTFEEWTKKKKEEEEKQKAALTAQEKAMGGINNESLANADSFEEWTRMKIAAANGETYTPATEDIAPVAGGKKDTWFKSGGFSDGVDGVGDFFGDLGQTTAGTVGDVILGATVGFGRMFEGLYDLGVQGMSRAADFFGADETAEKLKQHANTDMMGDWAKDKLDYVDQYSVLGDKSDAVAQGFGQVGGIILTGNAGATAGLGAGGVSALTTATTGLSSMGTNIGEAYKAGATDGQAFVYGLSTGAIEAGTELLFGGLGKGVKALGLSRGLGGVDDMLAKGLSDKITKLIAKDSVKKVVGNTIEALVKATGEGVEEVAAGLGSALMKKLTYASEEEWEKLVADENLLESFIVGAVTSSIAQGSDYVKANASKTDFVTGHTSSEEKVIQRAAEKEIAQKEANGEKLTKKDKNEIYDRLSEDISRGYISIDTIEETLGGDKYTEYKKASDDNAALKKELDELRNMKSGDMTDIQRDRLTELKAMNLDDTSKIDELKKQMSDDVLNLVKSERKGKGSLLMESYNEKTRRGEGYTVDLKTVDSKKQDTYKRAMEAGILNNTNRTHDFVDLIATLESERGVKIDFANNQKLKESGFAIDGVIVNGVKTDNGILLNVESGKSLDTVVDTSPVDVANSAVLKRLNDKLSNSNAELTKNEQLRAQSNKSFDEKIAKAKAELDAKKNKDTKTANAIKRRIERLERLKSDRDAEYAKHISDIKSRIVRQESSIEKYHPGMDRVEKAVARIDATLEHDKSALTEEYELNKEQLADKDAYIRNKAAELYSEIRNLKKGVRASELLGELLDSGYEWSSIRAALANVKHGIVNQESTIEPVVREMLNEDYESRLLGLEEDYTNDIKKLEEDARTAREKASIAAQRQTKQEQYTEGAKGILGDTSKWRDKKLGISYRVNTLRRNLRDVVRDANGNKDIAAADAIYDYLQGTYNHNEALLKQESQKIKQPFIDMKINKYESTYAQMLGELRANPDTTLTKEDVSKYLNEHKNKIDTKKVDKIIEEARKVYDDLIRRVNEVLREQGMREIAYRKGYFPHFTEDKQSWIAKLFNWKTQNNDIPTDIAGLTEQFEPVRSYQSFNKQRTTDETVYNFKKGFDTYVHGALDWIYHIEDIQKRRAFENEIRYSHSEQGVKNEIDKIRANDQYDADEVQRRIDEVYEKARNPLNNFVTDFRRATQTLAGKKATADRQLEYDTNRHMYSTLTNISNRVSANMVAGSISSALTNFIPITQSWSQVSQWRTIQAMGETIRNYVRDDGTVMKSDFLTNRLLQEENLDKTVWDKIGDKVGGLMEIVDGFTSQVVWRSKYNSNIAKGMTESQAIENADKFAEGLMAGRSRGNMPTIFEDKNLFTKLFTAFQLEVANQYGYMFKDMPNDIGKKNILKLVNGYGGMFIGAYVYNALTSALTGRDAAFDPIGIFKGLMKDLGFGDDDEEEADVFGAVSNLAENVAQEIPFVGGLLGGGRFPISSAMPYDLNVGKAWSDIEGIMTEEDKEKYTKSLMNELVKPLYYFAMPMGGGQLKKTIEGLSMFSDDHPVAGSYTESGNLRFPVEDTIGNRIQAALFGQYANDNARYYFDNDLAPLKENQIQEYIDVGMPIEDYWEYREGLRGLENLSEKADYINSLDLPIEKKNLLINNLTDRKEPIDMTGYDDFGSLEEMDFAVKNPEKYEIAQKVGGYEKYMEYQEAMKGMTLAEKADYVGGLNLTTEQKNALINGETTRKEPIDMTDYDKYSSLDEMDFAKKNPAKYTIAKAVGGYDAYKGYSTALNNVKGVDNDGDGKSDSGTRKTNVINYLNTMDIEYGEKLILFRAEYPADDTYNYDIVKYLEAKEGLTYQEKLEILAALGMTVDAEGNVSW